jgi:hypothetical protein
MNRTKTHFYLALASSIIFALSAIMIATRHTGHPPNWVQLYWGQRWWLGAGLYGVGAVAWLILAFQGKGR